MTTGNSAKPYWSDLSRKVGSVFGHSVALVALSEWLEQTVYGWGTADGNYWHHVAAVIIVAVIRAVVGLVQGKVGDPQKASWTGTSVPPPADVPDTDDDDDGAPDPDGDS